MKLGQCLFSERSNLLDMDVRLREMGLCLDVVCGPNIQVGRIGNENLSRKLSVSLALPCGQITPRTWKTHLADHPVCPGAALILFHPLP